MNIPLTLLLVSINTVVAVLVDRFLHTAKGKRFRSAVKVGFNSLRIWVVVQAELIRGMLLAVLVLGLCLLGMIISA